MIVIIDTNQLPRDPSRGNAGFRRLCDLSTLPVVNIMIPTVVAREWETQAADAIQKEAHKAATAIEELFKRGLEEVSGDSAMLRSVHQTLQATYEPDTAAALARTLKDSLISHLNASVLPILPEHGARVCEDYFSGGSPFSSRKNRKDFPDAFIYQSIRDLDSNNNDVEICVICNDKNLAEHLSLLSQVTTYHSINSFVESDAVENIINNIQPEIDWLEIFDGVVEAVSQDDQLLVDDVFNDSFVKQMSFREINHHSIPSDNNDAHIAMIDEPENIVFHWDDAEDYGPSKIRVPFSVTVGVLLNFSVYHANAYSLSENISVSYGDPELDHFFDAEAHANVNVLGFALITVDIPVDRKRYDIGDSEAKGIVDEIEVVELLSDLD